VRHELLFDNAADRAAKVLVLRPEHGAHQLGGVMTHSTSAVPRPLVQ
jgi:hypothetical protein